MNNSKNYIDYGLNSLKDILKNQNIINENVMDLMASWENIVGFRFKDKTKIIKISEERNKKVLVVAVSSSGMMQELNMFKREIIDKINMAFNIELDDIVFSTKFWDNNKNKESKENKVVENYNLKPTQAELNEIQVELKTIEKIKKSIENIKDEKDREKMFNIIMKDIKTQQWKKNKGFPVCSKCGVALNSVDFDDKEPLCVSCNFEKNNEVKT